MKRKLKVNDFFCGCGGMGIAFKNAGYEIAGAWDFDKYAVESYRANVGDHVQKADIKELHQADIPQSIKFTHYGTLRGLRIRRNVCCSYFWGCPTHNHKLGQLGKERKSKWQ